VLAPPASSTVLLLSLLLRQTPRSPLFPYTTLFRSPAFGGFALNAAAGPGYPGTPTYTRIAQPVIPRITALTANEGPTIGTPVHPSQLFSNKPIRILGCGIARARVGPLGSCPAPMLSVHENTNI